MLKNAGYLLFIAVAMAGLTSAMTERFNLDAPAPAVQQARAAVTAPAPAGPQSVSLAGDASGHFVADVKINGLFVKGLVDTGATSVALSPADARLLGIAPKPGEYTVRIQTANGEGRAARVTLDEVRIGAVVVRGVEAVVVPEGLSTTLIGMSFLKRLGSTEMRGRTLVLRQ